MEIDVISRQFYVIDDRLTDTNRYQLTNSHRSVSIDRLVFRWSIFIDCVHREQRNVNSRWSVHDLEDFLVWTPFAIKGLSYTIVRAIYLEAHKQLSRDKITCNRERAWSHLTYKSPASLQGRLSKIWHL